MIIRKGLLFGLVISFMALAQVANAADKVFVENTRGAGVSSEDKKAATELVRVAVGEAGESLVENQGDAEYTLRPKLLKLGSSFILSISKVEGGKVIHAGKLKAKKIEELDMVATRLTEAVINERNIKSSATVDNVTETESTAGMKRKPAMKGWYAGLGPAWLANLNAEGIGVFLTGGHAWDLNDGMVKLGMNTAINGSANYIDFILGGNYFFSKSSIAPFVGGEFGYGAATVADDSAVLGVGESISGFVIAPTAGIVFLRTSSLNIEISGRMAFLLKNNANGEKPIVYSIRIGIFFAKQGN